MRGLLIFALLCSPAASAPVCNNHVQRVVVKKNIAHVNYGYAAVLQQVTPVAYYAVGQNLQEEALAERIARLVDKKLASKAAQRIPQAELPLGLTVLTQKCAGCHKPESKPVVSAGAPILFDATGNLTATPQQVGSILTATKNGIMPPPPAEPLDDDSYLSVKQYLGQTK
jgi:mono/diheme cytochrome c family protein